MNTTTRDPADAYPWILYLNPDIHVNEYKLVKNASLESLILIQDVRSAPGGQRPGWLSVLPALVDTRKRMAYRGDTCIKKLVSIELPPEYLRKLSRRRNNQWATD